jgi:RNA polymerase subunit RPABC4/transcription elongation factor Spt4
MDILSKIGTVTKSVVDKTSNKVSTVRMNARINSLKTSIAAQKQRIGDFYWLQHRDDKSFDPALAGEFKQIAEYLEQIAALEKEIQRLAQNDSIGFERTEPSLGDSGVNCPACGAANTADTKFCVSCGAAFILASEANTCGNCGAIVDDEMKFCAHCGTKLKDDNPSTLPASDESLDDNGAETNLTIKGAEIDV